MVDLFRKILLTLCSFVYDFIPSLYDLFYDLASAHLFTAEEIQKFASNIYILISVIMLFAFGVKLIEAIVNPDLLADTKKGTAGVFKRAIIALGLIVFIPYGFNKIYDIQSSFLKSNFFEKLIIGNTSINNYSNSDCSDVSAGQIMAGTALHQFLYPENYGNVVVTEENSAAAEEYNEIMVCDISKLSDFSEVINEEDGGKYTFHFDGLFALGAGIFLIYELVILCIDTALRLVKLGFLQLIAPIIVSAYIFTGTDNLVKYLKEVGTTFAQVFVRVAAFAFYILVLSKIESALSTFNDNTGKLGTIFFLIGALQFVKLVPNLLGSLFGMNIQNRGGIKGRLGEMAGVGGLAQKAWHAIPRLGALGAGVAAYGAAKGVGFLGKQTRRGLQYVGKNGLKNPLVNGLSNLGNGIQNFPSRLKNTPTRLKNAAGKGFSNAGSALRNFSDRSTGVSGHVANALDLGLGGLQSAVKAGGRALKFTGKNLSAPLAAGKAAIASGTVLGAISAGTTAFKNDKNYQGYKSNVNLKRELKNKEEMNLDADGNFIDVIGADGKVDNKASVIQSKNSIQAGNNIANSQFREYANSITDYGKAQHEKIVLEQLNKNKDSINSDFTAIMDHLNNNNDIINSNKLNNLFESYKTGNISESSLQLSLSDAALNGIIPDNLTNTLSKNINKFLSDKLELQSDIDFKDIDLSTFSNVGNAAQNAETHLNTVTKAYENAKNKAKEDGKDDSYISAMDDLIDDYKNVSSAYAENMQFSNKDQINTTNPNANDFVGPIYQPNYQSQTNTGTNTNTSSDNRSTISYNVSPEGVTTSGGILLTGSAADEVLKSRNRNNNTTNNTNNSESNGTTASNTAGGTTIINNNYGNNSSNSNMNNNDDVINKLNDINNSINAGTAANVAATTASAESIINNDKDMSRQQQNRDKIRDQVVKEESDETQSKIDEIISKMNKE